MSGFAAWIPALGSCALLLALTTVPAATAGEREDRTYRELAARAASGDPSVDFRALRFACIQSTVCDPRGDTAEMRTLREAFGRKDYRRVTEVAHPLIQGGFPNIEAHILAARAWAELKEPEKAAFHQRTAAGLLRSIMNGRDGKSKQQAFEVIGTHEEYLVLRVLGFVMPASQAVVPGSPHSYDVVTVQPPGGGAPVEYYFNIDAFYPPKM